mgnify:CR=1 FL=1
MTDLDTRSAEALNAAANAPVRLDGEGAGVYVWPDRPDWCVPNERGDFILARAIAGQDPSSIADELAKRFGLSHHVARRQVTQLLARFDDTPPRPHEGRTQAFSLDHLGECWLHVTNRCNASCGHCMFACSPETGYELDAAVARSVVDEAISLGCKLFYFTGGEPTLHPNFCDLCERILAVEDAHVVVLTNALTAGAVVAKAADWPTDRVHFQVSVDGDGAAHDALRGAGAYECMTRDVQRLRDAGFAVTLAMTVHRENLSDMTHVVELAARLELPNVHYMWLFPEGQAGRELMAEPEAIWPALREAAERAETRGVQIDNLEILRSQVFSLPGTRFDLSNAGWQSLAVGPDGEVYPSPAMMLHPQARCGNVRDGLETVWRDSPRLNALREASLEDSEAYRENPLRYLVGGGDVDHSLVYGGSFVGHDPYVPLYNRIALWLIAHEARRFQTPPRAGLRLRMGEYLHECDADSDGVMFTHSNCVLSLPGEDGHSLVREFYAAAAEALQEDIVNPVQYGSGEMDFIPQQARVRSYGCGSPVADAALREGETVVDLGCGAGMEVFLAARAVGPGGRAIGIDMLPPMLERARSAAEGVARNLGFANTEFHQALLEELPLADASADVVISNCVINLCPQKRQAFAEILRVLKPGGRLVISDVTSQDEIPIALQYNEKMRGECLGGAFRIDRLFELLGDVGFDQATILKRFPYRTVRGHAFFSVTYSAVQPAAATRPVMYRGPFAGVVTDDGRLLRRGKIVELPWQDDRPLGETVFVLDADGQVTNVEQEMSCCCSDGEDGPESSGSCCAPPERETAKAPIAACCCTPESPDGPAVQTSQNETRRHRADCMVCGAPLQYRTAAEPQACHYCGQTSPANALCAEGHFVCDACHGEDALEVIRHLLVHSTECDLIALLDRIRRHRAVPIHGPEHHSLVPGILVAAYRNAGGSVGEAEIEQAIRRGATIAGGSCAFLGICGAAAGVGTGFSILLGATPYDGGKRQQVQQAVTAALADIASLDAPRCCQRDCWIALRKAAELSPALLDIPLRADAPLPCRQAAHNAECIGGRCPLWPSGTTN